MAKKNSMMSKLKKLQKGWESTEPRKGGAPLPDGTYACRIESATLEEAKESQRLQIVWALIVVEGDCVNRKIRKYDGMDSEDNLGWVLGTLESLEIEIPEDITEIGIALEAAQGLVVEITVKTNDEFTNIYINELLDGYEDEDEEDEDEDEEEEEDETSDDDDDEEEEEEEDDDDDEEDDDEEEEEEDDDVTEDTINEMSKKELLAMIKDDDLDVKVKKNASVKAIRKVVINELFE